MLYKQINIEYANPDQLEDSCTLTYNLRNHAVVDRWINKVLIAQKKYSIDDPGRFWGFGSKQQQKQNAITKINKTIDIINQFERIIDRRLTDINDQDTLNYLHHIFEVYHGLLNQQTSEFWLRTVPEVRRALANLNIQVHECEAAGRSDSSRPIHSATWYNLPKVGVLADAEYTLFEDTPRFGTVYLLYAEIGKSLEDLAQDDDQYIHDEAFRPFRHYSADFFVSFYNENPSIVHEKYVKIKQYYDKNKEFFNDRGLQWGHPHLTMGNLPLADITSVNDDILTKLETRQWVKSITFN